MSSPNKKKMKKPTSKKTSSKIANDKTMSKKTKTILDDKTIEMIEEAKKSLEQMQLQLKTTAYALPSLVLTRNSDLTEENGLLENKFEMDVELIGMLEEFFERLVMLLNLRSSFDKNLHQTHKQIKRLQNSSSVIEFKGNLQILGITLVEMEQIIKNYQEMYTNLFTEQALLQFQLMEQLMMFRDKDIPNFYSLFEKSLNILNEINEKLADVKG